jgi:hypothetical protein
MGELFDGHVLFAAATPLLHLYEEPYKKTSGREQKTENSRKKEME